MYALKMYIFFYFYLFGHMACIPWPKFNPPPPALETRYPNYWTTRKVPLLLAAASAKLLQSCPTLCDPIDGSLPGSPIPGILQARTLERVAISPSNAWKWKVTSLSGVQLLATPWTAAHQAPLPMGFSRQEYWSGVPLPYMCSFLLFLDHSPFLFM